MKIELYRSQAKELRNLLDAMAMAEHQTGTSTGKVELPDGESKIEWDAIHVRIAVPEGVAG